MWSSNYIYVPGILAVVLFFVGLGASWRRVIGYVICTYAAIVIASQHYQTLTEFTGRQFGLTDSSLTWRQQSSIVFIVALGILYIGLLALYNAVWRPRGSASMSSPTVSGWSKLLRGLTCALSGWVMGAIVVAAMLVTASIDPKSVGAYSASGTLERGMVLGVNEITGHLIEPWLPGEPPYLLQ